MLPYERSLVKRLEAKPFALIGVNSDTNREEVKKKNQENQITWRSFWNGGGIGGPISSAWNVQSWPTLYLLDAKGTIRHKYVGAGDEKELDVAIELLIKETEVKSEKPSK
jgi:hypothetical protein